MEEVQKQTLPMILQDEWALTQILVETEGEILPDLEKAKAETDLALRDKIDAYAFQLKRMDAEVEFRKAESAEQKVIQKRYEKAAERMRATLIEFMAQYNKTELMGNKDGFITYKASIPSVSLKEGVQLEQFAAQFIRVKTTSDLDKESVLEALKSGSDKIKAELNQLVEVRVSTVLRAKASPIPKLKRRAI